jgi:tetratricopeptide (TPR) repeat protein
MGYKSFVLAILAGFIVFGCTSSSSTPPSARGSPNPVDSVTASDANAGEKGAVQNDANHGYTLFDGFQLRVNSLMNRDGQPWYPNISGFLYIDIINPEKSIPLFWSVEIARIGDMIIRLVPLSVGGFNALAGNRTLDDKNIEPVKTFMAKYIQLLDDDPSNFIAHNDLGVLYSIQGDWKKAMEHFTRAIEINKNYFVAYYNRGMALGAVFAMYEAAIEDFSRAIEIRQDIPELYYVRGNAYYCNWMFTEAMRDFETVKHLKPDFEDIDIVLKEVEKRVH